MPKHEESSCGDGLLEVQGQTVSASVWRRHFAWAMNTLYLAWSSPEEVRRWRQAPAEGR